MRRKEGERREAEGRVSGSFCAEQTAFWTLPPSAESTQAGPRGVGSACYRLFSKGTEKAGADSGPIRRLCLRRLGALSVSLAHRYTRQVRAPCQAPVR